MIPLILLSAPFSFVSPPDASSSTSISTNFVLKRTSPPRLSISFLMLRTISTRRSVPICGFASYVMLSSAPCSTKISRTLLIRPYTSLTCVFSFPSEKVPAPPSPNCALDSGLSFPPFQNESTDFILSSTASPRSTTTGL